MLSRISEEVPLQAAILLRRTGAPLTVWTRPEISSEVVAVMAATMTKSIETIAVATGGRLPETIYVKTDMYRAIAMRVEREALLVLIAGTTVVEQQLRRVASKVAIHLRPGFKDRHGGPA